ncbi:uncharacterized protein LOC125716035 isoform X4 [Brienomyrus brachyistius]|uniref:uncharacterized protein LOC125716035 isoform X4 n=1 Tax=Brienomyrus brachyistius TaxID=42636 RepID=UPI0020B3EEB3|nr:uncharacterized protein LOC125716035 isoform X4 [Brienomyrus brachyistius]
MLVFEVSLEHSVSISGNEVLLLAKTKEEMTELSPNGFPLNTRLTRESTTIKLLAGKVVCYASTCVVDITEHTPFYNRVQTDLAAWAFVMGLGLDGVLVTDHWADIRTKIQPKECNPDDSQGDRATKRSRPKLKALVQDFSTLINRGKKRLKEVRAIILGRLRIANKRAIRAPSTGNPK